MVINKNSLERLKMRVEIVEFGKGDAFYFGGSLIGEKGTFVTTRIDKDGFSGGYIYLDRRGSDSICLLRVKTKPIFDA